LAPVHKTKAQTFVFPLPHNAFPVSLSSGDAGAVIRRQAGLIAFTALIVPT
jgi:hypothetical protein